MATTTFTAGTVVASSWLNDVDEFVYQYPIQGNSENAAKYYTTDMGAALQGAHDALGPDGGTIIVPASTSYWTISTTAAFTKPIRLVGEGWFGSEILTTTNNLQCITTISKLDIENISFTALGAALGTAIFVRVLSSASTHGHSLINNCYFEGSLYGYWSESTNAVVITNCTFGAQGGSCLLLENLSNPDTGDSFIAHNTFGGTATTICVKIPSTSGINFTANKFNSAVVGHILIEASTNILGNYLFANNSFEGQVQYAIKAYTTTGTITKVIINGNQFSSEVSSHVVIGNGVTNTVINSNIFNSTTSASGIGVSIESGANGALINGNNFHQILTAIALASGVQVGATVKGNVFASDVTNMCSGDDAVSSIAAQKEIGLARYITTTSNSTYSDAIKLIGYGVVNVNIYGVVQGAGVCNYHRKVLISGTSVTDIDTAVTSGSVFDVQLAASGGYLVVSVKRNGATGTSLTLYVDVTATGQITDFKKA